MDIKTRNRLFITQIKGISYDKKINGAFSNIKNSFKLSKSNKEILKEKRDTYNFIYINIMEAYQIDTEGIVKELDDIWMRCYSASDAFKKNLDNGNLINKIAYYYVKASEHTNITLKFLDMNQIFNSYIQACIELANNKIKKIEETL